MVNLLSTKSLNACRKRSIARCILRIRWKCDKLLYLLVAFLEGDQLVRLVPSLYTPIMLTICTIYEWLQAHNVNCVLLHTPSLCPKIVRSVIHPDDRVISITLTLWVWTDENRKRRIAYHYECYKLDESLSHGLVADDIDISKPSWHHQLLAVLSKPCLRFIDRERFLHKFNPSFISEEQYQGMLTDLNLPADCILPSA